MKVPNLECRDELRVLIWSDDLEREAVYSALVSVSCLKSLHLYQPSNKTSLQWSGCDFSSPNTYSTAIYRASQV